MNRYVQPGWKCIAMSDPSNRRGLWYRVTPGLNPSNQCILCGGPLRDCERGCVRPGLPPRQKIEFCAGREGDDHQAEIVTATPVSSETLRELEVCLSYADVVDAFTETVPTRRIADALDVITGVERGDYGVEVTGREVARLIKMALDGVSP